MTLLDSYHETGSDLESFQLASIMLTQQTHTFRVFGRSITFLSFCQLPHLQVDGQIMFYILDKPCIDDFLDGKPFHLASIPKERIPDPFLEELKNTTGLAIKTDNKLFIVSDMAIPTMTLRASVSGNSTINRQNLIRDMHLADAILSKNEPIHLVYRTEETADGHEIRKVFSCLGSSYKPMPQTILADAASVLQDDGLICRAWSIGHDYTRIFLDRQGKKNSAGLVPGIMIQTSDIGLSSLITRYVLRDPGTGSYVILSEHTVKHSANITVEDVVKNARKLLPKQTPTLSGSVQDISATLYPVLKAAKLPEVRSQSLITDVQSQMGIHPSYKKADLYSLTLQTLADMSVDDQTKDRVRQAIGATMI